MQQHLSLTWHNQTPCPKMITTTSKIFIKIQGLWWVVMQYHTRIVFTGMSIFYQFIILKMTEQFLPSHTKLNRFLYLWFHYQCANISSEGRFMKHVVLKNTLCHGWSCWRKMYNSIYNTNTNVLQIRCWFHKAKEHAQKPTAAF